ncbi:MAG: histone deacetylase [Caldilineaceae bacterium]|nr:histone deacetylase [Caldilineaceae bacterium]
MTTAYVYDPFELNHTFDGHPENHRRLEHVWALLERDGILDRLTRLPENVATLDPVLAVHGVNYVAQLEDICQDLAARSGGGKPSTDNIGAAGWLDQDTYILGASYEAALRGVGGLLSLTDAVMIGAAANGFALVRPPGHHARPNSAKGFCLLGNVAVAARHAQRQHGAQRVLIVDFDVHHGNGTAEMFYDDSSVLFFSIHQYPHYPFSGTIDEIGRDVGEGYTVNVPFPAGVGDAGYLAALRQVLTPLAYEFAPDVIFLSAGFDGHWLDPLSEHRVSVTGYARIVEELIALADALCRGRLICTLEGGYHLDALPHCVLSTLRALCGDEAGVSDPFGEVEARAEAAEQVLLSVTRRLGIPTPGNKPGLPKH